MPLTSPRPDGAAPGGRARGRVEREARHDRPAVQVVEVVLVEVVRRRRRRGRRCGLAAGVEGHGVGPVEPADGRAADDAPWWPSPGGPPTRSVRRSVPSVWTWYSLSAITVRPLVPVQSVPSTPGPLTVWPSELRSPFSTVKPRAVEVAVTGDPVEEATPADGPGCVRGAPDVAEVQPVRTVVQVVPSGLTWMVPFVRNR